MSEYAPENLERCCPGSMVRHVYDESRWVLNGVESSRPIRKTVRYECAKCGKELKSLVTPQDT